MLQIKTEIDGRKRRKRKPKRKKKKKKEKEENKEILKKVQVFWLNIAKN